MPGYDFKTLSPIDFELLSRDLLQEELQITLQSFTCGRDTALFPSPEIDQYCNILPIKYPLWK